MLNREPARAKLQGCLAACGLGHGAVSRRVRTGRLHPLHRGVYGVGHRPVSQESRWMAAVLAAGDGAALSHLSAAVLWRIWRRAAHGVDVLAPRRRRTRAVRVHACRNLDARDTTVRDGIPVTTVARTLVDLTDVLSAHQLANVIHEAAFRNLYDRSATRAAMRRAPGRRLTVLAQALALNERGSAGTKSNLEDRFLAVVRAARLPEPLVNAAVATERRPIEVDFRWGRVCVEVDGGGHRRWRTRAEDEARDRALQAAGYTTLRVRDDALDRAPEALRAALGDALRPPPRRRRAADPRPP